MTKPKQSQARKRIDKYSNDPDFQQELAKYEKDLQQFRQEITQLAESINKISLNTKRLKQAFEAGDFSTAHKILDQTALLKPQQVRQAQETQTALKNNIHEYVLKPLIIHKPLKSSQHPDIVFNYAVFLQKNNQFRSAHQYYQPTLKDYHRLAQDNQSCRL